MVNFVLRHSGFERRGISKDILPFPLWFCPTAADIWVCFILSRVRWNSPAPQLRSISSRVDRFDRCFPQRYLVHLDLQPVTFEQAHLVDFDTVVSTCQGRQCGHKYQLHGPRWTKLRRASSLKITMNLTASVRTLNIWSLVLRKSCRGTTESAFPA